MSPHGVNVLSRMAHNASGGGATALLDPDELTGTVTIVVADDHQLVRRAIRMVLEAEPDFEIVGEAGDVRTAGA